MNWKPERKKKMGSSTTLIHTPYYPLPNSKKKKRNYLIHFIRSNWCSFSFIFFFKKKDRWNPSLFLLIHCFDQRRIFLIQLTLSFFSSKTRFYKLIFSKKVSSLILSCEKLQRKREKEKKKEKRKRKRKKKRKNYLN